MNHRITKQEMVSFEKDLFTEASNEYGTWSYVSCRKIDAIIPRFRKIEANQFVSDIVEKMLDQSSNTLTKYKLSQLCSLIAMKKLPQFAESFLNLKEPLEKFISTTEKAPLIDATVNYIRPLISIEHTD